MAAGPVQRGLPFGIGSLHAGGLPGYPESHGCVHLPYEFARELFSITDLGVTVVIQGDAATHVSTDPNSLLAPFDAHGRPVTYAPLSRDEYRWQPELSPNGPMTLIVSKLDQRIVVLRNGVEIGRSFAHIDDADAGTHVIHLVLQNGRPHWVYVGLPGHVEDAGKEVDEAIVNRVRMPRRFYELVRTQLQPGTTILVTNSRVGTGPSSRLTIMDAIVPDPN